MCYFSEARQTMIQHVLCVTISSLGKRTIQPYKDFMSNCAVVLEKVNFINYQVKQDLIKTNLVLLEFIIPHIETLMWDKLLTTLSLWDIFLFALINGVRLNLATIKREDFQIGTKVL